MFWTLALVMYPSIDVDRINVIVSLYDGILIDDFRGSGSPNKAVMTIVTDDEHEHNMRAEHGSLLHVHSRMVIFVMTKSSR